MSGIAGIIHFDGAPSVPGQIEKMTSAMAYRGPDGIHHWSRGSIALGHCMLRTTPESLEEHQPLTNEDESLVLVMDGRVDNWVELRQELLARGAALRNRSDAELVLRAYQTWGNECVHHIDGDFALVIWDSRRREAFCARDRIGNKPFNYYWNGNTLVFASELHAILALPWVPQVPNEGMLAEYLAEEWHSHDETLWSGVLRLVAGHRMIVANNGPRIEGYWAPALDAPLIYARDEDYFDHYRELLADSVRRLSRSHLPVAIEVSGGLDSSAVFCMAEHLRRSGRLPAPGIAGYTLAFTDDKDANEVAYARAVGEHLGVPIHEIAPIIMPLSWYSARAQSYRDFPGYPNGHMHLNLVQQVSAQGSRTLLNGVGGDQWLGGSRLYYAEELADCQWSNLCDSFNADAQAFGAGQAIKWFIRYGIVPLLPAAFQAGLRSLRRGKIGGGVREPYWLSPSMLQLVERRRPRAGLSRHTTRNAAKLRLLAFLDGQSDHGREENDRLLATFGIEMRQPLYTPAIVQQAFSTPERLRLRGGADRYTHVHALQGLMPQTVLDRKSKANFSAVFSCHLDRMEETFTRTLPQKRADWLAPAGMVRLFTTCRDDPEAWWPMWILWNIFGCDRVFE